jgi:hypothetical protein
MSNERFNPEGSTPLPTEKMPPGFSVQLLATVMLKRASDSGVSEEALAQQLMVTTGFLRQLERGLRQDYQLGTAFIECCAEFLGEPWWLIQILAGYVKPSDTVTVQSVSGKPVQVAIGEAVDCVRKAGLLVEP